MTVQNSLLSDKEFYKKLYRDFEKNKRAFIESRDNSYLNFLILSVFPALSTLTVVAFAVLSGMIATLVSLGLWASFVLFL